MGLPQIVQTLLELAEQVESNNISESDARDRVQQVIESLAAYSAVTDCATIFYLRKPNRLHRNLSSVQSPILIMPEATVERQPQTL